MTVLVSLANYFFSKRQIILNLKFKVDKKLIKLSNYYFECSQHLHEVLKMSVKYMWVLSIDDSSIVKYFVSVNWYVLKTFPSGSLSSSNKILQKIMELLARFCLEVVDWYNC